MESRPVVDLEDLNYLSEGAPLEEAIDMERQATSPLMTRKRLEALLEEKRLRRELEEYEDF